MKQKNESNIYVNILYLGIIQLLRLGLPLLTFPYLTRVLGVENFGILAFSIGIVTYISLIVDFGFTQIATSKIAKIRDSQIDVDIYFSSVLAAKILLLLFSSVFLILALLILDVNDIQKCVVITLLLVPSGTLLTSTWFFIGLERMKSLVPIDIIGRFVSIPLIFIFVKDQNDIIFAALFQGLSFVVSGVLALIYIYNKKLVTSLSFNPKFIGESLNEAKDIFFMSLASNLYTASIPVFLGILLGPIYVAYYKVADNIRGVAVGLLSPISNATFSRVSHLVKENQILAKKTITKFFLIGIILAIFGNAIIFFNAELIVKILAGEGYEQSILVLKLMVIVIQLGVCNQYIGIQSLIPFGYKNQLSKIVLLAATITLISIYPLINMFGLLGAIFSAISAEFLILIFLIVFHRNVKLNIFSEFNMQRGGNDK
jgi:O-antigen/teichoic acid export membrane protein